MHDELREAGLRSVRWFGVAWACWWMVAGTSYALIGLAGVEAIPGRSVLPLGAVFGLALAIFHIAVGDRWAIGRAQPRGTMEPDRELTDRVAGFALALGVPEPQVLVAESDAPNVAALPARGADVVVVTTAARFGLAPAELDAVAALQMSLANDPDARTARRLLVAANQTFVPTLIALPIVTALVGHVFDGGFGGRIGAGVAATIVLWIGFYAILRRMRWGWGLLSDGVAVATTRFPDPLVLALRRLAAHNGKQVRTGGWRGDGDPFWAVPVRANFQWTSTVNDEVRSKSSTALVSDAALLLRATIVDVVCVHSGPSTMATWRTAKSTFKRLARAAGDHERGVTELDNTIGGVSVNTEGVFGGDIGPIRGTWTPHSAEPTS